jgi:hypothetical protein
VECCGREVEYIEIDEWSEPEEENYFFATEGWNIL